MRLGGTASWQIRVRSDMLIDCALWIRAAERLAVPADDLVPGPLDLDRPPAPISTADETVAAQWRGWWGTLVTPGRPVPQPEKTLEPAYGTPDPLGLAAYPLLAAIVMRRWPQAMQWQQSRDEVQTKRRHMGLPSPNISELVAGVERSAGRRVKPFTAELVLIPVRDDLIREIGEGRYLVPEKVYDGPASAIWITELVTRLGL